MPRLVDVSRIDVGLHLLDMSGQAIGVQPLASTVRLAARGNEPAFASLVAAYHADMARVAYGTCRDRTMAEDAVQAAWLVAWRKLGSVRDLSRVRAWLLRVTANEARQLVRRRGRVVEIKIDPPGDPRTDPASRVDHLDLHRALAHLDLDDRAILAMHYGARLSPQELGDAVGASPEAARKRLWRATQRLREELRDA